MSIIAIDYGTHKSGIAYAVEGFAFAHKTIATPEIIPFLLEYIDEKKARTLILGMPYNIDGSISKHAKRVLGFQNILHKTFPEIRVILHDERLTTSEASLSGVDDIDAESARLILVDYIENH